MTNNDRDVDDIRRELWKVRCERDEAKMTARLLSKEHEKRVVHIKACIERVFKKMNEIRIEEHYTDVSEQPPRSVLTYQTLLLSHGFRADAQERYVALVQRQNKELAKNVLCFKFALEDEKRDLEDKYAEKFRLYGQLSSLLKARYARKTQVQRAILRSLNERLCLDASRKTLDTSWKKHALFTKLVELPPEESLMDLNILKLDIPGLRKATVSPTIDLLSFSPSSKLSSVSVFPQNPLQRLAKLQKQVEARGREIQKRTEARGRRIVATKALVASTKERRLSDPNTGKQNTFPADKGRFEGEESMRRKTFSGDEFDIPDSVLNMSFSILDNPDLMFTPIQQHLKLTQ